MGYPDSSATTIMVAEFGTKQKKSYAEIIGPYIYKEGPKAPNSLQELEGSIRRVLSLLV
jgi:hypothetical protein